MRTSGKKTDVDKVKLKPWSEQQLVGVGGIPLRILGSAVVNIYSVIPQTAILSLVYQSKIHTIRPL